MIAGMIRFALAVVLSLTLLGCGGEEKTPTVQNMTGGWEAQFGDRTITYSLYGDGTYRFEQDLSAKGSSNQVAINTPFIKMAELGQWRLNGDELVFFGDEGTTGGLIVAELSEDQVLLKTLEDNGQMMFFSPVPLVGTTSGYVSLKNLADDDETPTTQPAE
jgi:hypothetical protein